MPIFLVEDHPDLSRVEADTWAEAEAKLDGKGAVIGELVEERHAAHIAAEFKFQASEGDDREVVGYGAVFGNVDSYGDVIAPGAFAKSLAAIKAGEKAMPAMLLSHNPEALPVGVWTEMSEDGHGLRVRGKLLDTTQGVDTYKALKAGAVTGLSIGFRPIEYALRSKPDEPRRTLKSVDLIEVSIVGFPANDKARVLSVKADEITTIRDLEHALRDAGMTKAEAVRVSARFQPKANQGDPDVAEIVAALRRNLSIIKG